MTILPDPREKRRRAAAKWLARMKGPRGDEFRDEFERWHAEPANAEAYARVASSFNWAALLRTDRQPSGLIRLRSVRRPQRLALATFLTLVLALPAAIIVSGVMPSPWGSQGRLMLSTRVGEIRTVGLGNGASVTLDSDTKVEIRNGNEIELHHGRFRFSLAASETPFLITVRAYSGLVRRGVFDISDIEGSPLFASLQGELLVGGQGNGNPGWVKIGPGHAIAPAEAGGEVIKVQRSPWPEGMLQFDDQPLEAAVALANRYGKARIRLADPALARLRVTGGFRSGKPRALAASLAQTFGLRLEARANGELWLHSS